MLFNSFTFLLLFLPITYLVFWQLRTNTQRYLWLTLTGYVFYAAWNWRFCSLMLFSTAVSYLAGLGIVSSRTTRTRKLCLVIPVTVDLLLLGFFKYWNFTSDSLAHLSSWTGVHFPDSWLSVHIILPIGISFYTFHTISYIVDSYRGVITPTRNFFEFSCYVSLFCQLVAGPIVRFRQVEKDLANLDHASRGLNLTKAWSFFMIGMVKKVLIADSIAAIIDPGFANWKELSSLDAWLCAIGYTYQLYFDFSGYSDMAVGLGLMFGIQLPQNFRSPYKATSPSDFWGRWHISLSSVLRDYLYIPLGGNRGTQLCIYRNLMVTMLLGGLWHGASWTFVFWGGYHGVLLMAHRCWSGPWDRLPHVVKHTLMFLLVLVGWVFFRCTTFEMAFGILSSMFSFQAGALLLSNYVLLLLALLVATGIAFFAPNTFEMKHEWTPAQLFGLEAAMAVCLIVMLGGQASPFLYFQF